MSNAYDRLRDRLVDVTGYTGREFRGRCSTRCPAHQDRGPSLSIRDGGDRVLVHCFAGCTVDDILAALGLRRRDLYDEPRTNRAGVRFVPRRSQRATARTHVTEPPDVPDVTKRAWYAAATAHVERGHHPGGPVPPW